MAILFVKLPVKTTELRGAVGLCYKCRRVLDA
jgi:hypothetical protein